MIESRKVTDGLLAFCEAALVGTAAEGLVGDAKAPDGAAGEPPYIVVYRVASGYGAIGAIVQPDDMRNVKYQLSAVGANRAQSEWILDRVLVRLTDLGSGTGYTYPLTVEDHSVIEREVVTDIGIGAEGAMLSVAHIRLLVTQ